MAEIPTFKPDPEFEKLVESGVFGSRSAAAYAFNAYRGLKQPDFHLMVASNEKTYTGTNFQEYLTDCCGVKPENKEIAMALLFEALH